jgi:hypothetical protein
LVSGIESCRRFLPGKGSLREVRNGGGRRFKLHRVDARCYSNKGDVLFRRLSFFLRANAAERVFRAACPGNGTGRDCAACSCYSFYNYGAAR